MNTINIGIETEDREAVAQQLKHLLADSYTLYLMTHNFHWNVVGPMFNQLHTMFEEHYNELAIAVDDIAERIRSLGIAVPASYRAFAELSSISEVEGVPKAEEMVALLTANHEQLVRTSRAALLVAQEANDESSAALISDRMRVHEKTAWMLRAIIS